MKLLHGAAYYNTLLQQPRIVKLACFGLPLDESRARYSHGAARTAGEGALSA